MTEQQQIEKALEARSKLKRDPLTLDQEMMWEYRAGAAEAFKIRDAREANLVRALEKIGRIGYGLELTDTDAEQAEYWSRLCAENRRAADQALSDLRREKGES